MPYSKEKRQEYWKNWYSNPDNRAAHNAKQAQRNKDHRKKVVEVVRNAKDVPCTDCGNRHPYYVMQFDHVRGEKLLTIGEAVRSYVSIKKVLEEIEKCEVVCANCHAARTWKRLNGLLSGETLDFASPGAEFDSRTIHISLDSSDGRALP